MTSQHIENGGLLDDIPRVCDVCCIHSIEVQVKATYRSAEKSIKQQLSVFTYTLIANALGEDAKFIRYLTL